MPDRQSQQPIPREHCLSVVIPAYNEAATIERVIRVVLEQPEVGEVIVVDDGSEDGTAEALAGLQGSDPRLRLLRHDRNQGKGAALRAGFAQASRPVTIVQDADLEYDPREYAHILAPILDGRADVVFGSRFIGSQAHRVLYFWHSVGNRFLTLLSNIFTNLNLTDMETCYKVFRTDVLRGIQLEQDRFGIEPELTAKVARQKDLRIYEVAVSYYGRTYAEGKKIGWRDGAWALWCILKYNLFR